MDRRSAWVLGIIFGGLFLCLFGFLLLLFMMVRSDGRTALVAGDRVGVVEVTGPITDSKKVLKELDDFREQDNVKSVVVRIDSPGGSVGASQEIYDAIKQTRKTKKVVASMGSLAASGGFYIACAAEKVFANPGTLTGSIGVIFEIPNVQGTLKWAGIQVQTLTAGKMKDAGSPFRELSADERAYFQGVLSDVHKQFIDAVAEGRGLSADEVRPYADGRVFTGRQAKEWKLVDSLGGFDAAVREAAKLAGISGKPKLEYPRQEKKFLRDLLTDGTASFFQGAAKALHEVGGGLQYRLPLE
jgi:protease IV